MKKRNSITLFLLLGLLMGALAFGSFASPTFAADGASVYDDDDSGDYDDDDGGDYDDDDSGDYDDDDGGDYDDDDGGDYDDDDGDHGGSSGDYDDDDGDHDDHNGDNDDDGDFDDNDDDGDWDDDDWDDDNGAGNGAVHERYGRISQRPSGIVGTWVIGGVSYTADGNTWVSSQNGSLSVGSCVEVKYRTANNTLIKIEAEREHECSGGSSSNSGSSSGSNNGNSGGYWNDTAERYGFVNTMPANPQQGQWVINGVTYTANAQTWINQQRGALRVGSCVEIKYRTADNTLVKIEVERDHECSGSPR